MVLYPRGQTPLVLAVGFPTDDRGLVLAKLLVKSGADVNMVCEFGSSQFTTPLIRAVASGRLDIVKFLVEVGADVNKTVPGSSPLKAAVNGGHSSVAQYLLQHGARS